MEGVYTNYDAGWVPISSQLNLLQLALLYIAERIRLQPGSTPYL